MKRCPEHPAAPRLKASIVGTDRATLVCSACGAVGSRYFGGHDDPYSPHPCFLSTGGEGRCDLCGGPTSAYLHEAHDEKMKEERTWAREDSPATS